MLGATRVAVSIASPWRQPVMQSARATSMFVEAAMKQGARIVVAYAMITIQMFDAPTTSVLLDNYIGKRASRNSWTRCLELVAQCRIARKSCGGSTEPHDPTGKLSKWTECLTTWGTEIQGERTKANITIA